jgi:hypothetical protein
VNVVVSEEVTFSVSMHVIVQLSPACARALYWIGAKTISATDTGSGEMERWGGGFTMGDAQQARQYLDFCDVKKAPWQGQSDRARRHCLRASLATVLFLIVHTDKKRQ